MEKVSNDDVRQSEQEYTYLLTDGLRQTRSRN